MEVHKMEGEEKTKQKDIEIIIELLKEEAPSKVAEVRVFIQNYFS
jgi:hypothetical protein